MRERSLTNILIIIFSAILILSSIALIIYPKESRYFPNEQLLPKSEYPNDSYAFTRKCECIGIADVKKCYGVLHCTDQITE